MKLRDQFAGLLARVAAARIRAGRPDWAEAMLREQESLAGRPDRLAWAFGLVRASFVIPERDLAYRAALAGAVTAMAAYQWSADESLVTVIVLSALAVCLGLFRPRHFLASGMALGVVVATVNGFESLSGLRPAYEAHAHSLIHCLRWLLLVAPALLAARIGRDVKLRMLA